jgi:DNA-binding NarL/FixJ family response regulator
MNANQTSARCAEDQKTIRVLIVEDDALLACESARSLEEAGIEVAGVASSGTAALKLLNAAAADAAIVSVEIEGELDGIETARQMRARDAALVIIFVTAHGDPDTAERIRAVNPEGFLLKPVMPDDLVSAVNVALKHGTA